MLRFVGLSAFLAALWLVLSGYFDNKLLLSFGVISIFIVILVSVRIGNIDEESFPIYLFAKIPYYWAWLFLQIGISNLKIMRQILAVKPDISPTFVRVKTSQETIMKDVIIANSITLTPGTVTVDLNEDDLLVHALNSEFADEAGLLEMRSRVKSL